MTVRRNILAGWLAHAVTLIVGLYLLRFVKDTLGDTGYGAWIFVNSIAGYAGLLYMGFGAAVCRYAAKYYTLEDWPNLNRVISSIFSIYVANSVLAVLLAGVVAGLAHHISDWEGQSLVEVRLVIVILGLNAAIGLWGSVFGGLLVGIQRYDIKRIVHIACTLARLGLVVSVLNVWPGLLAMALLFLAITVAENVAFYLCARKLVPALELSRSHISRDTFRECFSFTAFNAVGMVSEYLIHLTDTVVIGCILGTAATVPYYIALRLCQMVRLPIENIAEVILPRAGELHARNELDQLRDLTLKAAALSLLLIAGFAIGAAWFGERLLLTWLGPGEERSLPILMILLGAQALSLPLLAPKKAMMGMGYVRGPALFDFLQAAGNLVLSLILIQRWGVIGVAWGTLIPVAICEMTLLLPYSCRVLQISPRQVLQRVLAPQIVPAAALVAYCAVVSRWELPLNWLSLLGIAGGGAAVHCGLYLLMPRAAVWFRSRREPAGAAPVASSPMSLTAAEPRGDASVSVVIAACNASRNIGHALESVLRQTRTPQEILVVDDGSSDDTADLVAALCPEATLLRLDRNGLAAARNAGIEAARGEWIAFLEPDDAWLPHRLERQLEFAAHHDCDVICTHVVDEPRRYRGDPALTLETLWNDNLIGLSTVLIRRRLLTRVGGFDEHCQLAGAEDYHLWLRLAAAGARIERLREPLSEHTPPRRSRECGNAQVRAEIACAENIHGLGYVRPEDLRRKRARIYAEHALDAFHERDLTEARRWFRRSLAQRLDLRVLLRWLATHLPGDTVESIARWRRRLAACPPDPCPSLADRTVPPVEVAEQ